MELKTVGQTIEAGNMFSGFRQERYGMRGDTYMTQREIGEVADALWSQAERSGHTEWLEQIAYRVGLVSYVSSSLESVMALAKAHVTWADICSMKS